MWPTAICRRTALHLTYAAASTSVCPHILDVPSLMLHHLVIRYAEKSHKIFLRLQSSNQHRIHPVSCASRTGGVENRISNRIPFFINAIFHPVPIYHQTAAAGPAQRRPTFPPDPDTVNNKRPQRRLVPDAGLTWSSRPECTSVEACCFLFCFRRRKRRENVARARGFLGCERKS